MADFPNAPVVGTVYSIDGINMLCIAVDLMTGRGTYTPIAELNVYDTVATMKLGINPSGHRCTAVRYSSGGKPVTDLNYISRGIGWPVTADGYVNHSDSKGNFLELQLVNDTISMAHTGADDTGVADAAPHLRAAMARLNTNGGGTLLIPKGTFYLNSGDPRGLKIAGTPDFYTVCEIISNVTVRGLGDGSVLKYNSNRIGVAPATGAGDVGALFANFRVRASSNTPYTCTNFNIENLKVEFTTLTNQTVDFIDGQVVRVYSLSGSVTNGAFYAKDVNVTKPAGHQAFSYEKVDRFESSGCRFYSSGKLANTSNTDVSLYYVTGTQAVIRENYSTGSTAAADNSTFIELHTAYSNVTGNVCIGMNTFLNAVSQVTHPGAAYDFSEFRVDNNHARDIRNFVVDWVAATNRKSLLHINDNTVTLRATATTDIENFLRHSAITGASDLPTEVLVVADNVVVTSVSGGGATAVAYSTSFDALIRHEFVKELTIVDNDFKNTRRGIILAGGTKLQKLTLRGNKGDFGCFGNSTNDDSARVSRSGITVNFQASTTIQKVTLKNNDFTSLYGGAQINHGVFLLNSGGAVTSVIDIDGNAINGTIGEELSAVVYGGNSFATDSIKIQHIANKLASPLALAGMYPDVTLPPLVVGSKITYLGTEVEVTNVGASKEITVFGKANAAPTTGYYSAGSYYHNTGTGVLGWKCDASGTPGTWVAKG